MRAVLGKIRTFQISADLRGQDEKSPPDASSSFDFSKFIPWCQRKQ